MSMLAAPDLSDLPYIAPCEGEPMVIAFSGGGDSTALVHMMRQRIPKPLLLIVDHDLRDESSAEAWQAAKFAQDLGLEARVLRWGHDSPTTGIQEKARRARYGLIGDLCRREGISHLLTGHTEDDQAETLLMRRDRGTDWRGAAGMKCKSYAPLWPELAGVFLHRPLLGISRQTLRAYNRANGLTWSEDPSNENPKYTRIRARKALGLSSGLRTQLLDEAAALQRKREEERCVYFKFFQNEVKVSGNGFIYVPPDTPTPLLAILLRAASGTGGPIPAKKLESLSTEMGNSEFKAATLGSAQVKRMQDGVVIGPDPALIAGRSGIAPMKPQIWPAHQRRLWAGRFWIETAEAGMTVAPLVGRIGSLPSALAEKLRVVPGAFRGALPIITRANGDICALGTLLTCPEVRISSAVAPRLHSQLSEPEFMRHNM